MPDAESPYRMMTYRALAEAWSCSVEAAQERVRRHRWPKRPGNGRQMLVAVPLHVLEEAVGDGGPRTPTDLREELQAQREREFQALRQRAEDAEALVLTAKREAAEARREADRAQGEAAGLREALRFAEDAARRADDGRREGDARALDATRRADAADAAQRAFVAAPWWRRLVGRP